MASQKKPKNYINNAELFKKVVAHLDACDRAEKLGKPLPVVPNDIALAIMSIAERFSTKPCYISYAFREDMVAEAVKNCIEYIRNVDRKRPNVFNYFTQVIQYAFWRYIKKEKKNLYAKFKLMQHINTSSETSGLHEHGDENQRHNEDVRYGEDARSYIDDFITDYEAKQSIQKAKIKEAKAAKAQTKTEGLSSP